MKDCPRCGSALSHYALADGEAYGCDACGWVGVDVEHRSKPATLESWHDAIARFEAKFTRDGAEHGVRNLERVRDDVSVPDGAPEGDPEPTVERVPSDGASVPEAADDESESDEAETDADATGEHEDVEEATDVEPAADATDADPDDGDDAGTDSDEEPDDDAATDSETEPDDDAAESADEPEDAAVEDDDADHDDAPRTDDDADEVEDDATAEAA